MSWQKSHNAKINGKKGFICNSFHTFFLLILRLNMTWTSFCEIHPPIHKEIWKPNFHVTWNAWGLFTSLIAHRFHTLLQFHWKHYSYCVTKVPYEIIHMYLCALKCLCMHCMCFIRYIPWESYILVNWIIYTAEGACIHLLCSKITRSQLWRRSWRTLRTNFWLWKKWEKKSNGHIDPNTKTIQ